MMTRKRRGRALTFYSYKGGVGRSMALANVAALLVKWGKRVLVVDWDLEAPGLERFFSGKEQVLLEGHRSQLHGVVDLLLARTRGERLDWKAGLLSARFFESELHILSAGKDSEEYPLSVQRLNWPRLYDEHDIGRYIVDLREEWTAEYDFVLIDSRTGVTDIGDVCTALLPDILVLFFVTNHQNVEGTRRIVERARKVRRELPLDEARLVAVPVPSRDEFYSEYGESQRWKEIYERELGHLYQDWLPKDAKVQTALNVLSIPYVTIWSFGERLPVLENEHDIENPASISAAYGRLAKLLVAELDWHQVAGLVDEDRLQVERLKAREAQRLLDEARAALVHSKKQTRKVVSWSAGLGLSASVMAGAGALLIRSDPPNPAIRAPIAMDAQAMAYTSVGDAPDASELALRDQRAVEARMKLAKPDGCGANLACRKQRETLFGYVYEAGIADGGVPSFTGLNLERLTLKDFELEGVDFSGAVLSGVDFRGGKLAKARLNDANLDGAVLESADLTAAALTKARLGKANLDRANLSLADLRGADLRGASLADTVLTQARLEEATYDENTKLPKSFYPMRAGMKFMGRKAEPKPRVLRNCYLDRNLVRIAGPQASCKTLPAPRLVEGKFVDACDRVYIVDCPVE